MKIYLKSGKIITNNNIRVVNIRKKIFSFYDSNNDGLIKILYDIPQRSIKYIEYEDEYETKFSCSREKI